MLTRRALLEAAAVPLAAAPLAASPGSGFPAAAPQRALFPCPAEGAEPRINPPGFAWWRADGAQLYRLVIRDRGGKAVYEAAGLQDPVHLPTRSLPPGEYTWDIENSAGARRGSWRFRLRPGLPEMPWEDPRAILARVPDSHPRYVFLKEELPALRRSLASTRRAAWDAVRQQAERALKVPLPEPPRYHTFEGERRQRMGYTVYFREFRRRVDSTLTALSAAWLFSGDDRYAARARDLLLEIESWGIEGPMSVLSSYGDEPGLSLARHGHRAYDWLHPFFTASERDRVRNMTIGRARQVLERLRRADYLARPAESHNGRMIAYLSEYAVVVRDEAPDSAEWLDYSLRALTTFYPHWGDSDGGWAEGISYALAYNTIYLGALESLRAAAGVDLYQRPFFGSVRRFFLYCTSPKGEIKPFGDGAERGGVGAGGVVLLTHHGRRFRDPACVWWAEQTGESGVDPLISLATEDNVKPAPPADLPQAAVFRGIGWTALHSSLDQPGRDTFFLLKSSPFGSVSHSHADQNSFAIQHGGRALAIPSGYYGPAYSMPHHAEWTRRTKANNCILVDGAGQLVRDDKAAGRISAFRHQKALTYVCGDAAAAYGGKLTRFLRHVLYLRPGVFAVLDDLAAPQPARFDWLLHAFDRMTVDGSAATVVSARRGATLTAQLHCEGGLAFSQTDRFDTPFNEGNPPEYREERDNQWHFRAATKSAAAETQIAALLVVRDAASGFTTEHRRHPGWAGIVLRSAEGAGEIWAQVTPGAPGPLGKGILAARWKPAKGAEESLMI